MPTEAGSADAGTAFSEHHGRFRERLREHATRWGPDSVDLWERQGHLPREIFAGLGQAGFFRERWADGRTSGLPHAIVMAEELALVCSGLSLGATLHTETFLSTLTWLARGEAQEELVESALEGDAVGCFALTEPSGGSDIANVRTVARREEGGWRIQGEKRYISNAKAATHAIVVARDDDARAHADLCLFLVDLAHEGVELVGTYPTLGVHACDTAHLRLDLRLPAEGLLGAVGGGMIYIHHALQLERISISAQLLAASRASLGLAVAHARERRIADHRVLDFQALRHRLADAQTELWASEAFLHRVVIETVAGRSTARQAAALKLKCAKTAAQVVDESLQVLGGRGFTANYPVERFWRDIRVARIGAGTDELMRELVASGIDRPDRHYEAWRERLDEADLAIPWSD